MNTILSEYFTLGTSVKNKTWKKMSKTFVLWHFLKPVTLSLQTISPDSLFVIKKYIYINFGSKVKSTV